MCKGPDNRTLTETIERLSRAGCLAPDLEAAELIEAADDEVDLASLLERREQGVPIAWLVGAVTFCGEHVLIDEGVYVPRPQSEELARRAGAHLARTAPSGTALDLCTGSGAVAIHLRTAAPAARVLALDVDERAVRCARRNGLPVIRGDLRHPPLRPASVDLITAVTPYVPTSQMAYLPRDVLAYEPAWALDGGKDGLDLVREALRFASMALTADGALFLELGGDQDVLLEPDHLAVTDKWHDEDGDLRGVTVSRA